MTTLPVIRSQLANDFPTVLCRMIEEYLISPSFIYVELHRCIISKDLITFKQLMTKYITLETYNGKHNTIVINLNGKHYTNDSIMLLWNAVLGHTVNDIGYYLKSVYPSLTYPIVNSAKNYLSLLGVISECSYGYIQANIDIIKHYSHAELFGYSKRLSTIDAHILIQITDKVDIGNQYEYSDFTSTTMGVRMVIQQHLGKELTICQHKDCKEIFIHSGKFCDAHDHAFESKLINVLKAGTLVESFQPLRDKPLIESQGSNKVSSQMLYSKALNLIGSCIGDSDKVMVVTNKYFEIFDAYAITRLRLSSITAYRPDGTSWLTNPYGGNLLLQARGNELVVIGKIDSQSFEIYKLDNIDVTIACCFGYDIDPQALT